MEKKTIQGIQPHAFFWTGELDTNFWGHIFEELYKSRIYDPYLPLRKEGSIALDIGANVGLVTEFFSRHFEKVYSLEPSTDHMENFLRMVNQNQLTNVTPIKKAIYIENGTFGFGGPDNNKTMKSLHMGTPGWKEEEKVEAITLDKLFEDYKIDHVNLMKCDCEGSEVDVFSHSSFKAVADKIDTIIVESHAWSGRHPHQLNEALKNAGFSIEQLANDANLFVAKRK